MKDESEAMKGVLLKMSHQTLQSMPFILHPCP